jgi:hypothetical protein
MYKRSCLFFILVMLLAAGTPSAQTTEFTYQGRLTDGSLAANGTYEMQFSLWDGLPPGGVQIGSTITNSSVSISNGVFTVRLDFTEPNAFDGSPRWLGIAVKRPTDPTFTTLTPRQPLTSTPYAVKSLNSETATTATNSTQLGGVDAAQYVITTDTRMTDDRNPLPNSTNYIQNATSTQANSNFNVSGNGIVVGNLGIGTTAPNDKLEVSGNGIVRARVNSDSNGGLSLTLGNLPRWSVATVSPGQFQIYNDAIGQNAFWIDSTTNNVGIGTINPGAKLDVAGSINVFSQYNIAGNRILGNPGSLNLFGGIGAGTSNISGAANTFVGDGAGRQNLTGNGNSYFGRAAGENSTGSSNSFVGVTAGQFATGVNNAYFGAGSGRGTGTATPNSASENAFFGYQSGMVNTSGNLNAFFGAHSGRANETGLFNAFFGAGSGIANVTGSLNSFFGMGTGDSNVDGHSNSFFGRHAGDANTSGSVNVFIGIASGQSNTTGHYNTILGGAANVTASDLQFASAIGARAAVGTSDTIVLGKTAGNYDGVARPADTVQIPGDLTVAGAINGTVANATTAENVSGIVPIANGGTGSSTKNFVDLSTNQTNIAGNKRFLQTTTLDFANIGTLTAGGATFNGSATFNGGNPVQMNALDVGNGLTADVASVSELNATNGVSGNVINSQTHFSIGGQRILQGNDESLLLGRDTTAGSGLVRATAIGNGAHVGQSDSIVLGTTPGFFLPVPNTRVGIGVQSPTTKLDVGGQVLIRSNIGNPPTGGGLRGLLNVVQTGSGDANFYMQGANGPRGINFSTNAIGVGDARLIISHYDGTTYQNRFAISGLGDIGIGTITPTAKLDVEGTVRVGVIGLGGVTAVCFDASLILSSCSSSGRYKHNVNNFTPGLELVRQFRPVSFSWNANNIQDMGLVAEEVAKIEPLLVTRNSNGEVEGVKYDRIGMVLVNAVKEQQAEIDELKKQIEMLKVLVCADRASAAVCK